MDIKLCYNPIFRKSALYMDGRRYRYEGSRLHIYLETPVEKWTENFNCSYKSWNGFFVELIDEINDDDIAFTFVSDPKYFGVISAIFETQKRGIVQKGFSPEGICLSYRELYDYGKLQNQVSRFIQGKAKTYKSQYYMERMRFLYQDSQKLEGPGDYLALHDKVQEVFRYARDLDPDPDYWEGIMEDFNGIFFEGSVKDHE